MQPQECPAEHEDSLAHFRQCVLPGGHDGDHEDVTGETWTGPAKPLGDD